MVEADFLTLIRAQRKTLLDVLFDSKLPQKESVFRKQLKPVFAAGGEEIEHYITNGKPIDTHTWLILEGGEKGYLELAIKKRPQELSALRNPQLQVALFGDYRIPTLVSLIKAAYLTLFWKLGYRYALSSPGMEVGYYMLGSFYRENHGKSRQEVQAAAAEFFRKYVNMARPVVTGGSAPRGTIEDDRAIVWLGSSGRGLAIGVFVRTVDQLHCVLMPAFCDDESAALYWDSLNNVTEKLIVREMEFDESMARWTAFEQRLEMPWPKKHNSFDLSLSPEEILIAGRKDTRESAD